MAVTVCLFTVVYPGCEPFLPRFFDSIKAQSYKDFELIVLNNGLQSFKQYTRNDINTHEIPVEGSIAEVRSKGIQILMAKPYEKIIFADADDFFSPNRVSESVKVLEEVDICVNDLTVVKNDNQVLDYLYFSNRITNGFEITNEFILEKNFLGLGNTAVRRSALDDIWIPKYTIAVDWIIFTDMLLRGYTAQFSNDMETYYRQYDQNTAGLHEITPDRIKKALKVQLQNSSYFAQTSKLHRNYYTKLKKLDSFLLTKEVNLTSYTKKVKNIVSDHPFWWEEIVTLDKMKT